VAVAQEKSIRIGHAECISATNYPKATVEKIDQLKWYFAHASVGANMMDGVTDLHAIDKSFTLPRHLAQRLLRLPRRLG